MVAPSREYDIDQWVALSEHLSPLENFCLIGLLFFKPYTPPSIIAKEDLVTDENISKAEEWILSNFRKPLAFLCVKFEDTKVQVTSELIKNVGESVEYKQIIKGVVKALAPAIVTMYSVPLGIAVALLFFLIGKQFQRWCGKYAKKKFDGKGTYTLVPSSPVGGYPPGPYHIRLQAYFELEYYPSIEELVEDPAGYPLKIQKVVVKVPSESRGKLKVPTSQESEMVMGNFISLGDHSYNFIDSKTKTQISGSNIAMYQNKTEGDNILEFISVDLKIE